MKVKLINYTKDAKDLLIFSKKTRLKMSADNFEEIKNLPEDEKVKELDYVFGTIGSSWEFIDYIFLIEGVSRAFTHQLVRHRVGVSFAQQAMRVVDASNFDYIETGSAKGRGDYKKTMMEINNGYRGMLEDNVHPQDARGVLPTNICTNILMKANLRTLSGLLNIRLCVKAQGEFQDVARELKRKVIEIHPWSERILQVHCVQFGTCAFPGYADCPVKKNNLLPEVDKNKIYECWLNDRAEYQPKGD